MCLCIGVRADLLSAASRGHDRCGRCATLKAEPRGGDIDTSLPFKEAKEKWVDVFEARYLRDVFEANSRNITHAAAHAGIGRRHFRTLLRKHGIIDS